MKKFWIAPIFMLFFCKKSDSPPAIFPPGSIQSIVSFNANLSAEESFDHYDVEYKNIRSVGARGAQTSAPWGSLNPSGNSFDLATISNPYFGLGKLVADGFEEIFLNIPIIAIANRSMPSDIITLSFDDPVVLSRFHGLLDAIQGELNEQVKYISLGNEVDTYFSKHPTEWHAYKILVEDARSYLKTMRPNVSIGVTTTFSGATSAFPAEVQDLNANMDAVMLTYYPIGSSFSPRDPGTVSVDISKMIDSSLGKPVVVQEWGYPSSTSLGSSEYKQAEFMYNSLVELEKQGVAKFPFVSFFKYRDWSAVYAQTITAQNPGQPFYEFMSSLGLKRNDGSSKQAFTVVQGWLKP